MALINAETWDICMKHWEAWESKVEDMNAKLIDIQSCAERQ